MSFGFGEILLEAWAEEVEQVGEEVTRRALAQEAGELELAPDIPPPSHTTEAPESASLAIDTRRYREEQWETLENEQKKDNMPQRRDSMAQRTTTDILKDFVDVPAISSAVVVGRDGFVIEALGDTKALGLDALGASLAHAINGIEMMGQELQIRAFQDLFIEYEGALIISRPVGDAIIALVAADASQLGIVRYMIKPLVAELVSFF